MTDNKPQDQQRTSFPSSPGNYTRQFPNAAPVAFEMSGFEFDDPVSQQHLQNVIIQEQNRQIAEHTLKMLNNTNMNGGGGVTNGGALVAPNGAILGPSGSILSPTGAMSPAQAALIQQAMSPMSSMSPMGNMVVSPRELNNSPREQNGNGTQQHQMSIGNVQGNQMGQQTLQGTTKEMKIYQQQQQNIALHKLAGVISPINNQDVASPLDIANMSPGSMSPIGGQSASQQIPFGQLNMPNSIANLGMPPGSVLASGGHIAALAAQKINNDGTMHGQEQFFNATSPQQAMSPMQNQQQSNLGNMSPILQKILTSEGSAMQGQVVTVDSSMKVPSGVGGSSGGQIPLIGLPDGNCRFLSLSEYAEFLTQIQNQKAVNPQKFAKIKLPDRDHNHCSPQLQISSLADKSHDWMVPSGEMKPAEDGETRTTMMLRNIPNKYTQPMLLHTLEEQGFARKYDFFYLPIDFRNRCNVGYAFINFVTPDDAKNFLNIFHKYKLRAYNSPKVCEVNYARVQGLKANIEVYRNSPVNGIPIKQYRPLIFNNGEELEFPAPDAPLPPIQLRSDD